MISNVMVLSMIASTLLAGTTAVCRKDELEVVPSVDLSRYVGQWYEIARLPNRFQKKCADSVTANYTLRSDGNVQVVNRCRKASGEFTTATGKAKIVDKKSNAKLKVTFFWPFYGKYWILDLDPNYQYAVVGEPGRDYLWILSRTPQLDEALYQQLLAKMQARGFDKKRMIRTAHPALPAQPQSWNCRLLRGPQMLTTSEKSNGGPPCNFCAVAKELFEAGAHLPSSAATGPASLGV